MKKITITNLNHIMVAIQILYLKTLSLNVTVFCRIIEYKWSLFSGDRAMSSLKTQLTNTSSVCMLVSYASYIAGVLHFWGIKWHQDHIN